MLNKSLGEKLSSKFFILLTTYFSENGIFFFRIQGIPHLFDRELVFNVKKIIPIVFILMTV